MRSFILVLTIMCFSEFCLASGKTVILQDGKMVVVNEEKDKHYDYPVYKGDTGYYLKKWNVTEKSDPVTAALDVYKNKSQPAYSRKVWIVDKSDGTRSIHVEFLADNEDAKIIFSPDEDYVYYVGLTSLGENVVYGFSLLDEQQFVVDRGNNFDILTCDGDNSSVNYVVVQKGADKAKYYIYKLDGTKKDIVEDATSLDDLKKFVCY